MKEDCSAPCPGHESSASTNQCYARYALSEAYRDIYKPWAEGVDARPAGWCLNQGKSSPQTRLIVIVHLFFSVTEYVNIELAVRDAIKCSQLMSCRIASRDGAVLQPQDGVLLLHVLELRVHSIDTNNRTIGVGVGYVVVQEVRVLQKNC